MQICLQISNVQALPGHPITLSSDRGVTPGGSPMDPRAERQRPFGMNLHATHVPTLEVFECTRGYVATSTAETE